MIVCRYLRNRELVLGIYLAVSAVVTVYSPHREASQPESQSALASLVWFSCAQSAEPIMLKGVLFAVRPGIMLAQRHTLEARRARSQQGRMAVVTVSHCSDATQFISASGQPKAATRVLEFPIYQHRGKFLSMLIVPAAAALPADTGGASAVRGGSLQQGAAHLLDLLQCLHEPCILPAEGLGRSGTLT